MSREQDRIRKKLERNPIAECNKIQNRFCPELFTMFGRVKDPRHQSYIDYSSRVMLGTMYYKSIAGISSMQEMTRTFNDEKICRSLYTFMGEDAKEYMPHGVTENEFLERLDPRELESVQQNIVYSMIRRKTFDNARVLKKWQVIVDATELDEGFQKKNEHYLSRCYNRGSDNEYVRYHRSILEAKIYFGALYPNIKICAGNVETQEIFEDLKNEEGLSLFEGDFYRIPVTKGQTEIAPLKANYIELLNMVNDVDFELTRVADVIGRDTALVLSLLEMVNRFSVNSEITSIRHAAAMLGQRELKKWINTIVTKELCADRPSEVTRISLLRAKFAEMLAPLFGLEMKASELFLMGLFSVLDLILSLPMDEALKKINVSKEITEALVNKNGEFANVLDFMIQYEAASWQEVSRMMILQKLDMNDVYDAYLKSICWYRDLVYAKK